MTAFGSLLPRLRRASIGGGIALAALTAPLLAVLPGQAQAAEVTTTVQFAGCEVRDTPYGHNTQVGPERTWSPSLSFAMPTPIASHDEITVDVDLGDLPANVLPEDLTEVWVSVWKLQFISEHWNPLNFYDEFYVASLDKDVPLAFPALEYETDYVDPGVYHHRVKSVELLFTGKDTNGDFAEYSFECDQVVNPQPILTTAVYDLSATPELVLDRATAQSGQSVSFTGTNLLAAAPAMPRAQASLTVGGIPVGSVEVDDSGGVAGSFAVPVGLSGTVEVRVSNGPKSASQMLQLSAGGSGPGGVDVNNPATWHPNAQGDVIDNQARLKAATKKVRSGKKVKLGGSGFAPGEAVIIKARTSKGKGTRLFTKVVYANASGAIKAGLRLKRAAKGSWRVTAIGVASGHGGATKVEVR
ncbi:hypothetical protein RB608_12600 [Nocardioides sp. LHD-245]|uniref:hypothetical protein n=1 Tax=Nocardioides sp. LHD-245 TaxID=3051387 RepID=UPI0027DF3FE4|nr:hypothetical protein [Nocardioides sp. LHD-245]